jgi:hypothetical protein
LFKQFKQFKQDKPECGGEGHLAARRVQAEGIQLHEQD